MGSKYRNPFEKFAKEYDSWYDKHRAAYLSELEAVKRVYRTAAPALEIGVGSGRFAVPLKVEWGIDPAWEMLQITRQRGCKVIQGVGELLPFTDSVFKCVLIITTLCFIPQPQKTINEVWRVLKNEGRLIVGLVDRDSFLGKIYNSHKKESKFYHSARFFSVPEVLRMLSKKRWKNIEISQSLYDRPEKITDVQAPRKGYGEGAFVVVAATKVGKHPQVRTRG